MTSTYKLKEKKVVTGKEGKDEDEDGGRSDTAAAAAIAAVTDVFRSMNKRSPTFFKGP